MSKNYLARLTTRCNRAVARGKVTGVELGYGFEKTAFGRTITTPTDYTTIFAKYVTKKE